MKRISVAIGDETVFGHLFEDKAPAATESLWDALPITVELRHARRSGNAAYSVVPPLRSAGLIVENQVSFCYPGSICLIPESSTLLWSYGQTQARTERGNVWATHLGEVDGESSDFFALLAQTQRRGVSSMTIARMED